MYRKKSTYSVSLDSRQKTSTAEENMNYCELFSSYVVMVGKYCEICKTLCYVHRETLFYMHTFVVCDGKNPTLFLCLEPFMLKPPVFELARHN